MDSIPQGVLAVIGEIQGGAEDSQILLGVTAQHRHAQLVLGIEVRVERSAGEPGFLADLLDGRPRYPLAGKDGDSGVGQSCLGGCATSRDCGGGHDAPGDLEG